MGVAMKDTKTKPRGTIGADFTEGPILRQLLLFTAPLFLSNLMQICYNVVDMAVVGQVEGQVGLSAVTVGGDLTNCLTAITMGFVTAGQVIIAQFLGGGQRKRIGPLIGTMAVFLALCVAVVSALCLTLRGQLLTWMSTPPEAWDAALAYITISLGGLVFICGYNLVSAILRGLGDSRHPFLFVAIASAINVVLDFLFVAGLGWGAGGAAAATVIAQAVSFLLALAFLCRNRDRLGFSIGWQDARINGELLGILVKLGFPMAIKSAAVQFTRLFTNSFINSYGAVVCAASGVASKINSVNNLLSESLNGAGAPMIGQNIGGEQYGRVRQILLRMLSITIPTTLVLIFCVCRWPEAIFGLFTHEEAVVEVCLHYVPIAVLAFFSSAIRSPMNALINGCGNYKINFAVAILDGFVLRVGLGLYLGLELGMTYLGFWLGDAIASYTPCVIGLLLLVSGRWKTNRYVINQHSKK